MNKTLVLLVLLGVAFSMKGDMYLRSQNMHPLSSELIEHVNSVQKDWVATKDTKFFSVD